MTTDISKPIAMYDIRYYANSAKRHVSDPRGAYVATVFEVGGGLRDWPDDAAVAIALPHGLRKAFARSLMWWADHNDDARPLSRTLRGSHGQILGTLYATRKTVSA